MMKSSEMTHESSFRKCGLTFTEITQELRIIFNVPEESAVKDYSTIDENTRCSVLLRYLLFLISYRTKLNHG